MNAKRQVPRWWSVAVAAALAVAGGLRGAAAQGPEALLEGAKKEGRLVWYTSMSIDHSKPLADAFTKKYPFLTVELAVGTSERMLNRIQSELAAGQVRFDAVALSAFEAGLLQARGLVQPYRVPQAAGLPAAFVDPEGRWVNMFDLYFVLGYNTKLVPKDQAPRDWPDLLDPKWRGKLSLDPEDYTWLLGLQEAWGRERANDFARKLAGQQIQWRKGHTLIAQLLAAGEFPLGLVYAHRIEEMKKKGAPVEWVTTTDPIPTAGQPLQIAARAAHPNAARLFVQFVASREAQTLIRELGRVPAHPDVELGWHVPRAALRLRGIGAVPPERAAEVIREWREIFKPTDS
ncbi:MAG TPA: extracellular solute-binding protein [Thermodesulfobacteriota bacterium]|nr:extracellular solute-binding protein [Thermodesulfobacteriota bacterium]